MLHGLTNQIEAKTSLHICNEIVVYIDNCNLRQAKILKYHLKE